MGRRAILLALLALTLLLSVSFKPVLSQEDDEDGDDGDTLVAGSSLPEVYVESNDIVDEDGKPLKYAASMKSKLDDAWEKFVLTDYDMQDTNRYCMRWCPTEMPLNGIDLYPEMKDDLPQEEWAAFDGRRLEEFPELMKLSRKSVDKLDYYCCHICTQDCFETLHDSRKLPTSIEQTNDITVLTFGTIDRLNAFSKILQSWKGPVIALFYMTDYLDNTGLAPEGHLNVDQVVDKLLKTADEENWNQYDLLILGYTARIDLDLPSITPRNTIYNEDGTKYPVMPINSLRNALFDRALTRFVFPLDMDFIPSEKLYDTVKNMMPTMQALNKAAFVVPHFQTRSCTMNDTFTSKYGKDRVPRNFEELKQAIGEQWVTLFHANLYDLHAYNDLVKLYTPAAGCEDPIEPETNYKNVAMTNNDKWFFESLMEEHLPYRASAIPDYQTRSKEMMNKWEPFLIVSRINVDEALPTPPRYNEIFFGRNKNKISFVNALRTFHYDFFYVRHEFIVHMEHTYSIYRLNALPGHYDAMKIALREYVKELDEFAVNTLQLQSTTWDSINEPPFTPPVTVPVDKLYAKYEYEDESPLGGVMGSGTIMFVVGIVVTGLGFYLKTNLGRLTVAPKRRAR